MLRERILRRTASSAAEVSGALDAMRREQFFKVADGHSQQIDRALYGKATVFQSQPDNLNEPP